MLRACNCASLSFGSVCCDSNILDQKFMLECAGTAKCARAALLVFPGTHLRLTILFLRRLRTTSVRPYVRYRSTRPGAARHPRSSRCRPSPRSPHECEWATGMQWRRARQKERTRRKNRQETQHQRTFASSAANGFSFAADLSTNLGVGFVLAIHRIGRTHNMRRWRWCDLRRAQCCC
jgi:hypothetical protein